MRDAEIYVQSLSNQAKLDIITGYEIFERQGVIGDEPIRLHARELMTRAKASPGHITTWMQILAMECYRYYAHLYLAPTFDPSPKVPGHKTTD